MEISTAWKNFSTEQPIQMSSWIVKSPNSSRHINSKSIQENHLKKEARNATSDNPYPSRPKQWSPRSQSRTRMINALPHPGSCQSSVKLGSWKEDTYAAGHLITKHPGARNIDVPTSPNTLLLQETENKWNTNAPSTVTNQKTSLPLLVFSSAGEEGQIGTWIAVIQYKDVDGNFRGNSAASDFIMGKRCLREPESSHIESRFVWNSKTGFIVHCPRSPDTRSTPRIAVNMCTHQLRRYMHLYVSTTSQ